MTTPRTLPGWKEIADYLGKSVRSVQRWELTIGLPVHRRDADGTVYADADEIDEWRRKLDVEPPSEPDEHAAEASPSLVEITPPRRHQWRTFVVPIALATALAAGVAVGRHQQAARPVCTDIRIAGRRIECLSSVGRVLWSYSFETGVTAIRNGYAPSRVADLDGDGEIEILVSVRLAAQGSPQIVSDAVYCFSRTGALKWHVQPDLTLTFARRSFSGPWTLFKVVVPESPPPRRTWLVFSKSSGPHPSDGFEEPAWPGFVVEVTGRGAARLRYVQAGVVTQLTHWTTGSGSFLAIAGSSEEHRSGSLVLVADDDPPATFANPDPASPFSCGSCPNGSPRRVILVPPTELGNVNPRITPFFGISKQLGPVLSLQFREERGSAIIEVNHDFSVRSFRFADQHWVMHGVYERQGLIHHPALICPERGRAMRLREWTGAEGWHELTIVPRKPDDS